MRQLCFLSIGGRGGELGRVAKGGYVKEARIRNGYVSLHLQRQLGFYRYAFGVKKGRSLHVYFWAELR